jgi:hypothetical protein
MLGRSGYIIVSWRAHRYAADTGVRHGAEGATHEEDGEGAIAMCAEKPSVGVNGK